MRCPTHPPPRRRLVRPLLLSLLSSKLRPGGMLHLATDVEEYAEHIERVMSEAMRRPGKKHSELEPVSEAFSARGERGPAGFLSSGGRDPAEFLLSEQQHPARFFLSGDDSGKQPRSTAKMYGAEISVAAEMGVAGACWEGEEMLERPAWRPLTSYERKAREAGRRVRDFSYRLVEVPLSSASSPPPPPT